MILFPAIDLKDGQVVRLTQGDYARMDIYDADPAAVARRFQSAGAKRLHVVDLDGARDGMPGNREALRALREVRGLFIQTGGGLRDEAAVGTAFDLGMDRVILGT
ncbi:MAG: HisA/HisF-related TIM barrel protein, partial [Clostridia bacterium]|nr:HisA/HisF-related TIM barrel protein [Clostridia bacterium]